MKYFSFDFFFPLQFKLPGLYLLTWNLKLSIKHYQRLPGLANGNMANIHASVKNKVLEITGHMGKTNSSQVSV